MKEIAETLNISSHPHTQTLILFLNHHSSAISLTLIHTATTYAVEYKPQVPPYPMPEHVQITLFKALKGPRS